MKKPRAWSDEVIWPSSHGKGLVAWSHKLAHQTSTSTEEGSWWEGTGDSMCVRRPVGVLVLFSSKAVPCWPVAGTGFCSQSFSTLSHTVPHILWLQWDGDFALFTRIHIYTLSSRSVMGTKESGASGMSSLPRSHQPAGLSTCSSILDGWHSNKPIISQKYGKMNVHFTKSIYRTLRLRLGYFYAQKSYIKPVTGHCDTAIYHLSQLWEKIKTLNLK
jgi:hypothetical protein